MSGSLKAKSVDELVTTFSVSPPEDNALISPILNVAGVKQFDKVKSDIVLRDISLIDVGKWSWWEKTGRMNKELVNENFKIYDVVKFIPKRFFKDLLISFLKLGITEILIRPKPFLQSLYNISDRKLSLRQKFTKMKKRRENQRVKNGKLFNRHLFRTCVPLDQNYLFQVESAKKKKN